MSHELPGDMRWRQSPVLPTLITLGNLSCGFVSILYAMGGRYSPAAWAILAGMIFDALDGKVARLTRSASDFGIELDSLSDIVTFGVAPAVLVRAMTADQTVMAKFAAFAGLLYALCAALRLARFNVDTLSDSHSAESHKDFTGLPTPGAAGLVAALVILHCRFVSDFSSYSLGHAIPFVVFFLAPLMISKFRYVHIGPEILSQRPRDFFFELLFLGAFVAWTRPFSLVLAFGAYTLSGIFLGPVKETVEEEEEAPEFKEQG